MTAARNANPVPASTTVSAFAIVVRGTTSPKPSGTAPGNPGGSVEQLGESDPPAHPARQDDRLERIPQHHREQHGAGATAQPSHGHFHDCVGTLAGGSSDWR